MQRAGSLNKGLDKGLDEGLDSWEEGRDEVLWPYFLCHRTIPIVTCCVQAYRMKHLQLGWVESMTEDGEVYYFNVMTNESLWDLPAFLKVTSTPLTSI
jgi:WW domain